ncbi:MAG: TetR/AcrR family transcriptional regulator [Paramuribaculum sp.]|nr:TetR/AcrR family transcriptional regulator [Paramuribaculum sp.]
MTIQSTENKILVAAEKEFLRIGYAAARTTTIADAAGVTHAMLHYYFRTKEKLFEKVIESKMELIRDMMLGSLVAPDVPLFKKLETAVSNHLAFLAANPDLPRFFVNEICTDPSKMETVTEFIRTNAGKVSEALQAQLDKEVSEGLCRKTDARMLLLDILSLNAFAFIASPLVNLVCGDIMENRDAFIEMRKKETLDLIMRKLKP